jgi:DNA-binding NtrC family response regulator
VPRVIARGPDGRAEYTLELDDQRAVLLGRTPDRQAVGPESGAAGRAIEAIPVAGPSVSGNHALLWAEGQTVCVRDLRSRNGTWVLLPKGQSVRVAGPEVVVQLAQAAGSAASGDEPAAPTWGTAREYSRAIGGSIERWLHAHGIEARATVVADQDDDSHPTGIPLAPGDSLHILPLGTTDASWSKLLERLWSWTARQNAIYENEEETRREGMILASRAIRVAHADVVDAAKTGAPTLLLTGATGAGKEMLAEVFHRHSGRNGPFVTVNCAMFSKDLFRSELFGAEAGSFTGATRRIVGAVERAQGGTLFLDEIGDMPRDIQPMLLRFLDRREYERIGQYGRTQRADVRVVAATNKDLRDAARIDAFRADLWFRLSVHEVEVPPLRARWDDVSAYLESVRTEDGQSSVREALSPEAVELLRTYPWEGNFRELRAVADRLSSVGRLGPIDATACRRELNRGALRPISLAPGPVTPATPDWGALLSRAVQGFVEDHRREPNSWDDQKEWNEKYLKPLLFFQLSGAAAYPAPTDEDALSSIAAKAAARVHADRGTAAKQLARYFERFGSKSDA